MFDDPVFFPVAIFDVQTSRYWMGIEYGVLKLLFLNILPLRRGVERVFILVFLCKRSKQYVEFKGLIHILLNPIIFLFFLFLFT